MPNRWESSGRPLFVKTVYVNGNRHAILSQEDPLLRSRASFFKKASRPNSSLSFGSEVSVTSSESRESNSVGRTCKERNRRGWKDLSSELQDCLVKLRLASSNDEKAFVSGSVESRKEPVSLTTKKQKLGRGKKKKVQNVRERFKENEPEDGGTKDSHRYVYNFDYNKGKKNYCFVKISSEPPNGILDSMKSDSDNLVISAAFHNLVMSPYKTEKISRNKWDYFSPFEDPAELYWKNYLTKSCYNPLSERVIQWLYRTRKRKRTQNSESHLESASERTASGRTFLDKNRSERQRGSVSRNEEVEGEVKTEPNVDISAGKLERDREDDERTRKAFESASEREGSWTNGWERRINREKEAADVDGDGVTVTCRCEKNRRDYANGFPERNQKSIDKPNVTRTRPISLRDLSPQQQKQLSFEHTAWASDGDVGRPQLHIFIPTVPSKDPSDESLSECEPQISDAPGDT